MEATPVDILTEIPVDKWPEIRDVFKKDWPQGIYTYYLIENFIRWNKKDSTTNFSIYCPDGQFTDGTIIAVFKLGLLNCIHIFTLDKNCAKLKESLIKTNLIKWSEGPFFYSVDLDTWKYVKEVMDELGLDFEFQIDSQCYFITRENAFKFDTTCPEDVYVGPLNVNQANSINELWYHKYPGSEEYIAALIRNNGGLGVYLKKDDTLVSWVMKNHVMGLGTLETLADHQRKGYAELVVKTLTKNMIKEDIDVHTTFINVNVRSHNLFKKLNFEHLSHVHFCKIKRIE